MPVIPIKMFIYKKKYRSLQYVIMQFLKSWIFIIISLKNPAPVGVIAPND